MYECVGSPGAWNRNISKMCLGFGDGSTLCGDPPESNLDYLYVTYTQFGSEDPLDKQDASAAGMQNGNIWLSISDDYGLTWAPQECLTTVDGTVGGTPTRSPGCDVTISDTCLSEHWSSCADLVTDTLHVFYLGDLDAGSIPYGEGNWAINDLMYLPIFGGTNGDLCPYPPCDCGVWGDVNNDGAINPQDVIFMVQYVYYQNDMRVQPPNCPLQAGDVTADGTVNPQDVTFYVQYVYYTNDMFCDDPCGE